jgi:hypothetical protein
MRLQSPPAKSKFLAVEKPLETPSLRGFHPIKSGRPVGSRTPIYGTGTGGWCIHYNVSEQALPNVYQLL